MINDTIESVSQELFGKSFAELNQFTEEEIREYMNFPQPPDGYERQRTVERELFRRQKVYYEKQNERLKGLVGCLANRVSEAWDWDEIFKDIQDVCGEDFDYYEHSRRFCKEQWEKENEIKEV